MRQIEEYNRLLKVKLFQQGNNQWRLLPVEKRDGSAIRRKDITFRGNDEKLKLLLRRLKAKDNASDPPSSKNRTYQQMINTAKDKSDPYIWIWMKVWNNYKDGKKILNYEKNNTWNGIGITKDKEKLKISLQFYNNMWSTIVYDEWDDPISAKVDHTQQLALQLFIDYNIVKIIWDDGKVWDSKKIWRGENRIKEMGFNKNIQVYRQKGGFSRAIEDMIMDEIDAREDELKIMYADYIKDTGDRTLSFYEFARVIIATEEGLFEKVKEVTGVSVDLCKYYDSDTDKCAIGCPNERVKKGAQCPYHILTRRDMSECQCYRSVRENKITLKKDLYLPGTQTILEAGDIISIIKERVRDYQVYHFSYSSAISEVIDWLKENNLKMHEDDIFTYISSGPKKPSEGKTNKFDIFLYLANELQYIPAKKMVHFQIYGMSKQYELNMYLSPAKNKDYPQGR